MYPAQVHPDIAAKLESAARLAKTAANAAKRSQTAVSRTVAEAVKALGPPAFASGVLSTALARLALAEGDPVRQRAWAVQAAEVLEGKVRPDVAAALAALVPPAPKPVPAVADGEEPLNASEMAALAEQQRLQRLDQADKERTLMGFVGGAAVEVADSAADMGRRLDLSSILSANEDEMHRKHYMSSEDIVAAAFLLAGIPAMPADGVPAPLFTGAAGSAVSTSEPDTALEVLAKVVLAMMAVRAANSALQLAGSHERVKGIEESLGECLTSCANIPKMAAYQLERALMRDDSTGEVEVDSRYSADELRAYEQLVTASVRIAELALNAATLITVSTSAEGYLSAAKADLQTARQALADLPDAAFSNGRGPRSGTGGTPAGGPPQSSGTGSFMATLQVLLSKPHSSAASAATGGAETASYNLVVGFAPPSAEPLPISEYLEDQQAQRDAGGSPSISAVALARAASWAELSCLMLQDQLDVVQGSLVEGRYGAAVVERLLPAQQVLDRPAMRRLLQPFVTLVDACNRSAAATAVAAASRPDDDGLLQLGAPDDAGAQAAAAANLSQFKRWGHEVANMQSCVRTVLFGLCKAQALAAAELPAIVIAPQPVPPPQPKGIY